MRGPGGEDGGAARRARARLWWTTALIAYHWPALAPCAAEPAAAAPLTRGVEAPGVRRPLREGSSGEAVRGITIGPIESSQQPGRGYGTEYTDRLLDELVRLGANAVSITPFGRLWDLRSNHIELDFEQPFADNRAAIGRVIAQAKARGLTVLLIPHLWVETGGWRGEIDPESDAGWAAYQASYRAFVATWARAGEEFGADAFSIGVECKSWSGRFGAYWSELIDAVRAEFSGQLTYSANWDEAEDVVFWDALDLVGINAFYPLAGRDGASDAEYAQGAARALERAGSLGALVGKPVLFVEIGYTARANAAVEPWLWPDEMHGVAVDEWEQARALSALMSAGASQPWLAGMFLWRYYANLDDVSQEAAWGFSPHGKLSERVMQRVFGQRWAADPDPSQAWLEPLGASAAARAGGPALETLTRPYRRSTIPTRLDRYWSTAPPATRRGPRTPGSSSSGSNDMK